MKSPTLKIQSPDGEMFVKIEPLVNPEPHSVPPLSSAILATGLAATKSAPSLEPDVKDATSAAASLFAWEGYPEPSMVFPAVISALSPIKTDMQPLLIEGTLNSQPATQYLPPVIDSISPVIIPVPSQEPLLNLDLSDYNPVSTDTSYACDVIHLLTSDSPATQDLYAPLYPVFNIYRDTYSCFDDQEYAKLPKPGPRRAFFYSGLICPPTRPLVVCPPVLTRAPVRWPFGVDPPVLFCPVDSLLPPRGGE